jgi:3-oxo-5-alpha-steroid 4-dehydrogenase 1
LQWILSWHPAGKTSTQSIFNIPGRIAWCAMEIVGPINLIYNLITPSAHSPSITDLPASNIMVASLYCIHYLNRAIISPFFSAPSMSPIHIFIMTSAILFNIFNSACLSGWLRGYTIPTIPSFDPSTPNSTVTKFLPTAGIILFAIGMTGNIYSETALFRLRREEAKRRTKKTDEGQSNQFHKVYVIPPARGVFRYILYPHYVFEWLEWIGFALAGTAVVPLYAMPSASQAAITPPLRLAPWLIPAAWAAGKLAVPLPLPAVVFVVNAVTNMLPHARWGRVWYVEKFGEKAVAGRGAAVPGCAWM